LFISVYSGGAARDFHLPMICLSSTILAMTLP